MSSTLLQPLVPCELPEIKVSVSAFLVLPSVKTASYWTSISRRLLPFELTELRTAETCRLVRRWPIPWAWLAFVHAEFGS